LAASLGAISQGLLEGLVDQVPVNKWRGGSALTLHQTMEAVSVLEQGAQWHLQLSQSQLGEARV